MTPSNPNHKPLFHQGHYNIIAGQVRKHIAAHYMRNESNGRIAIAAIAHVAITLSERLKEDNPQFDPKKWLDQCSPVPTELKLGEWYEQLAKPT